MKCDARPNTWTASFEAGRPGFFIVNMAESSQIADTAERLFFGVNAKIELVPVMKTQRRCT